MKEISNNLKEIITAKLLSISPKFSTFDIIFCNVGEPDKFHIDNYKITEDCEKNSYNIFIYQGVRKIFALIKKDGK